MQELARSLGIEWLYLPAYSPNLNRMERFWKWVKKQCLDGKYYPTSADFQAAIQQGIAQAHSDHLAELESLSDTQISPEILRCLTVRNNYNMAY